MKKIVTDINDEKSQNGDSSKVEIFISVKWQMVNWTLFYKLF